jgi:cytochrome c553
MADSTFRLTLRQLPLPAKLVLSVFLCAVGLGYFSAMVQLHLKHSSKAGDPLPSPADVVEVFSGLKAYDPSAPPPCGRIDTLLTGDPTAPDVSKDNMAPAFFAKSKGWNAARGRGGDQAAMQDQREGERLAMLEWVRLPDAAKKKQAYADDKLPLSDALKNRPITPEFLTPAKEVKIRTLVDARCMNCHNNQAPDLGTYDALAPLVTPPSTELIDGKWVRSSRQVTVEGLTQSTHAHLLSFAVLFTLTGLVFAFTSYPGIVRGVLGPVVLLAQVIDIACWWLARVPTYGPLFAQAIMGTGAVVGLGLAAQIVFGLLNMYGAKGKLLVLLLLAGGGAGVVYVGLKVIQPALDEERKATAERAKPEEKKTEPQANGGAAAASQVSQLEKLVTGPWEDKSVPWNGKGSMAAAFFDRDQDDFKDILKRTPDKKAALVAEREGERQAVRAWIVADPAVRKKAYDEDKLPLPPEQAGKPITAKYLDGTAVKVKSILTDRCVQCHGKDGEQPDYPLETYEQLMKYVEVKR